MTDTWDDDDLAIARALGADAPAGASVDADAVAGYEAVLGYLPFEEVPPRDLEDQVVAAALARRPASARSLDSAPSASRRRARTSRGRLAAVVAAAAAAVIVVVLIAVRPAPGPGSPGARIEPAAATGDLSRVLGEPGTRRGELRTPNGHAAGRLVLDAHGDGYLTDVAPTVAGGATRWLWLDTAAGPRRVGRLPAGSVVRFVVRGDVQTVRGVIVSSAPARQVPTVAVPVIFRGALAAS